MMAPAIDTTKLIRELADSDKALYVVRLRSSWAGSGRVDRIAGAYDQREAAEQAADALPTDGEYGHLLPSVERVFCPPALATLVREYDATIDAAFVCVFIGQDCVVCSDLDIPRYAANNAKKAPRPIRGDEAEFIMAVNAWVTGYEHGAAGFDFLRAHMG